MHRRVRTLAALIGLLWLVLCSSTSADQPLTDQDRQAIRSIIQAQIDAFLADDAETAFSFASPDIQALFGNPANFMTMVKTGYQAVYRPQAVFFQDVQSVRGEIIQQVLIIDQANQSVMATYPMERQDDGSWRINGCFLAPVNQQLL